MLVGILVLTQTQFLNSNSKTGVQDPLLCVAHLPSNSIPIGFTIALIQSVEIKD